ncbi:MAG: type II toxin-antitoxin system RelE family toxin [Nostoc sp. SerVER01]|nr:type II toxin-antitoxin system RelE/ParE family toxin [Nostoc sp. SerVER01]MDZ8025291.1 type II toxin-antitoxin system RelE/ParE family toxin [Nostoc sp. DedQUE11]MDZ8077224.1 type II toxin-antitoxin system RelE/ParE family toxin [Nostoc sp. DedQUE01]MDZ8082340.1 type II toxin-antitoxin system RelE/ParE family toxin [Nostoc sp. DcaGUA01]
MTYQIEISNKAAKQLKKLSTDIRDTINDKILALAENPRPSGVVKLENADNKYRIRVGNYRILYDIQDDVLIIKVVRVGHRRDVYRDN